MMDLVFKNLTSDVKYSSSFFERILSIGLKELKLDDKNIGVSINLVGEGRIKELNRKYRKKNKVTDVLSFPLRLAPLAQGKPIFFKEARKKGLEFIEGLPTDLGDIFICLSFAKKQAKRENMSIDKKLAQLTVHGFLHLLGYDHERLHGESKEMFNLERRVLDKLGT